MVPDERSLKSPSENVLWYTLLDFTQAAVLGGESQFADQALAALQDLHFSNAFRKRLAGAISAAAENVVQAGAQNDLNLRVVIRIPSSMQSTIQPSIANTGSQPAPEQIRPGLSSSLSWSFFLVEKRMDSWEDGARASHSIEVFMYREEDGTVRSQGISS
jgi:hypothetical protein